MRTINNLIAQRLGGKTFGKEENVYKFEKIRRIRNQAIKDNPNKRLIDLGVGEPDDKADDAIIDVLYTEAKKKENRFYADSGIQEFKDAAANYMLRRFNVKLNNNTEIIHCIGAKSALSMLPFIFINPGDITITTMPGYPVIATITKYLGGNVYGLPLKKENNFLLDIHSIPTDVLDKTKLLYLNYPNNPTGTIISKEFIKDIINFAKKNGIFIVHDAAYIELVYDERQESFLSVDGAKDCVIEIHSLSKSFNMTGWRIGFVCGNELIIKALGTIRNNMDSGQFIPIQKAGIYALNHTELIEPIRTKYKRRLNSLTNVFKKLGFFVNESKGTFFLYVEAPKGVKNGPSFLDATSFCEYLIKNKMISSVPWDDVGHFVRFSATFDAKDEKEEEHIIREVEKRLSEDLFIY